MPHPVFIFDGIVDMVYKDFERSEVGSLSVGLGRIPRRFFADCAGSSILNLLREGTLRL